MQADLQQRIHTLNAELAEAQSLQRRADARVAELQSQVPVTESVATTESSEGDEVLKRKLVTAQEEVEKLKKRLPKFREEIEKTEV